MAIKKQVISLSDGAANKNAGTQTRPEELAPRIQLQNLVHFRARRAGEAVWKGEAWALVNPTSFRESVKPQYSQRPVLGLSHEVLQYTRTATRTISMELWCSYHILQLRGHPDAAPSILLLWRNFFESLVVPSRAGLAPPLVAFYWPGAELSFKGVVSSLDIDYQRFAHDGTPIEFNIDLEFLEVADALMTSRKVWAHGLGMKAYGGKDPFGGD